MNRQETREIVVLTSCTRTEINHRQLGSGAASCCGSSTIGSAVGVGVWIGIGIGNDMSMSMGRIIIIIIIIRLAAAARR